MERQDPLLALGRLDGRLTHSPARTAWSIRARFEGAAIAACNAGAPTDANAIEAWIAGSGSPPRASEGLNDPLGVAAIIHYFFASLEPGTGNRDRQVRRLLRGLFDSEAEASTWSGADLVHYGPLWRGLRAIAEERGLEPSVGSIAERLAQMARLITRAADHSELFATLPDGRAIRFGRDYPRAWLVMAMVPVLLQRSGLSANLLPSLVPRHKFLCSSIAEWCDLLTECLSRQAPAAALALEGFEREMAQLKDRYRRTSRSRLTDAAELRIALPSITRNKLAIAVNATPAGAGYLMRQLER
ncbi:hypothetical protein CD351_00200 [Erythrobacter sp. KY5]|uniref:hypothetical protein n=1 Tax=Erythrobacter sp. KY5 TaxID=2011159 RepID=UPI000DBF2A46|nr:hypothetical protein [Erythrobacter sp. KY5]AWW72841.1 hypothetical protein CD351_00200 [Erythrobacter sp. KY5]